MRILFNSLIISLITVFICMNICSYLLNKIILNYENKLIKNAEVLITHLLEYKRLKMLYRK